MFLTFQPFKTTGDDVDFPTLNALKAEFSDMPVEFVSIWKGSTKSVEEALANRALEFRHLPKCGQVYVLNNITETHVNVLIDRADTHRAFHVDHPQVGCDSPIDFAVVL